MRLGEPAPIKVPLRPGSPREARFSPHSNAVCPPFKCGLRPIQTPTHPSLLASSAGCRSRVFPADFCEVECPAHLLPARNVSAPLFYSRVLSAPSPRSRPALGPCCGLRRAQLGELAGLANVSAAIDRLAAMAARNSDLSSGRTSPSDMLMHPNGFSGRRELQARRPCRNVKRRGIWSGACSVRVGLELRPAHNPAATECGNEWVQHSTVRVILRSTWCPWLAPVKLRLSPPGVHCVRLGRRVGSTGSARSSFGASC